MGFLPIPASQFFRDFAFDVLEYKVMDGSIITAAYNGLSNSDEDGDYIGFLMRDQPQIAVGNTLRTEAGLESFQVRRIAYDHYNEKPELLKAYY